MSEDEDTSEKFVYVATQSNSCSSLESLQSASSECCSDNNELERASASTGSDDDEAEMVEGFQGMRVEETTEMNLAFVRRDYDDNKTIQDLNSMKIGDSQEAGPECPVCLRSFSSILAFSNHAENNRPCFVSQSESAFSCVECEESFLRLGDWVLHMNEDHGRVQRADQNYQSKRYLCLECGFVGESQALKSQHVRTTGHKRFDTGPYRCSDCEKEFQSVEGLLSHMRAKNHKWRLSQNQSRECRLCGKKFKSVSALDNHSTSKHGAKLPAAGEKEWICSVCGRADFATEKALQAHMSNPGKQHTIRENPCSCPPNKLRVVRAHRTSDGFIYKAIIKCSRCHRFPVTIPLPADRAMAVRDA
ncbi:unnamed protein product [Albugo candida]|uniref:C2H2-type domain-containing protein n=1 Tax=Albugo candida TaxID=65357 RepID=A0A024GDC7_9STRA|nr:unnamed protein product [Albugo candida]|eukprot:CCI44772.1 unnamed protein product [Albugo candida]